MRTELGEPGQRLDIWLWRARFFATRPAANLSAISVHIDRTGMVEINKPGASVQIGDVLTFRKW